LAFKVLFFATRIYRPRSTPPRAALPVEVHRSSRRRAGQVVLLAKNAAIGGYENGWHWT
jgi:hypothetical protein